MNSDLTKIVYMPKISGLKNIEIVATNKGIKSLQFIDYNDIKNNMNVNNIHIDNAIKWLDSYFDGCVDLKLPNLDINLTAVQSAIMNIKYGDVCCYADVMDNSKMARVVGNVCRNNPILLMIPCHRVISKNGSVNYIGGADLKIWLLDFERGNILSK